MDRRRQILTGGVGGLLLRFGIPSVLATLVNSLYNVVDRIFVGKGVGENGLAALTVCFPMMMIMMAFGMLFALGGSSLIALYLGENDRDRAEKVVANGLAVIVVTMGLFTALTLIFLDPLLRFYGASAATLDDARTYMSIILIGSIPHEIGFGINTYIRGEGNVRYSVWTTIVGAVANIVLDALLVFVIPLGVKGVALGTLLAWIIRGAMVLAYYLRGKGHIRFHVRNMKPDFSIIGRIITIGLAPCMTQLIGSVAVGYLNKQLLFFGGDLAVAAYGVRNSLYNLFVMPVMGIAGGAQPIIGYNYGAGLLSRVRHCQRLLILCTVAISAVGVALMLLFPRLFIGWFADRDSGLMAANMVDGIRFSFVMMPMAALMTLFSNYFQSVGKPRFAIPLSVSYMGVFMPLLVYLIPRYLAPSLNGVWMSLPGAECLSGLFAIALMIYEWRRSLSGSDRSLAEVLPDTPPAAAGEGCVEPIS